MTDKHDKMDEEKTRRAHTALLVGTVVTVIMLFCFWMISQSIRKEMEAFSKSETFHNWVQEVQSKE